MNSPHSCYLLQGSNLGNRERHLKESERLICKWVGRIVESSSVYETAPWGNVDQSAFLNRVLLVQTLWSPEQLLELLLAIEGMMGRERKEKWEPRIVDLDILFYDDLVVDTERLTLPHPHLQSRRFVLEPLLEISPEWRHPLLKMSVRSLHSLCTDASFVKKVPFS